MNIQHLLPVKKGHSININWIFYIDMCYYLVNMTKKKFFIKKEKKKVKGKLGLWSLWLCEEWEKCRERGKNVVPKFPYSLY